MTVASKNALWPAAASAATWPSCTALWATIGWRLLALADGTEARGARRNGSPTRFARSSCHIAGRVCAFEPHYYTFFQGFDLDGPGLEHHPVEAAGIQLFPHPHQGAVGSGGEAVLHL